MVNRKKKLLHKTTKTGKLKTGELIGLRFEILFGGGKRWQNKGRKMGRKWRKVKQAKQSNWDGKKTKNPVNWFNWINFSTNGLNIKFVTIFCPKGWLDYHQNNNNTFGRWKKICRSRNAGPKKKIYIRKKKHLKFKLTIESVCAWIRWIVWTDGFATFFAKHQKIVHLKWIGKKTEH